MRGKQSERGANLVEAALIIPLLLILFVSAIDLGRAYFTYVTIIDAAREGARYASSHVADPNRNANTCAVIRNEAQGATVRVFDILQATDIDCARDVQVISSWTPGTPVTVTVRFNLPTLLGRIINPSYANLLIAHTAAFRIRCEAGTGC